MEQWNIHLVDKIYKPLQGTLPLRVLQIHPGASPAPLKCELIPTKIADGIPNDYDATSYTWGSPANPKTINCNGFDLKIQQNAFDMLTDLRHPDRPRTVWIDAICINQCDVVERGQQVSMMHKVYACARRVVVWLGKPDDESRVAMQFAAGLDAKEYTGEMVDFLDYGDSKYREKTYLLRNELTQETDNDRKLAIALVKFINRPWFNRVWVQQEASACLDTDVICGPDVVHWDQIFALAWVLCPPYTTIWPDYFPHTFRASQSNLYAATAIQADKIARFTSTTASTRNRVRTLTLLLFEAHRYGATDPRDKVYALQNITIRDWSTWAPAVSYSVPWEILYTDVALRILKNGWLKLLSRSGRAMHRKDCAGVLPSWVCDFRQRDTSVAEPASELVVHDEWLAGGGPDGYQSGAVPNLTIAARSGTLPKHHRRKIDPQHMSPDLQRFKGPARQLLQTYLSFQCLMMDEIVYTGWTMSDTWGDRKYDDDTIGEMYLGFIKADLDQLASQPSQTYMTGEKLLDAYKLTLIAATDHNDQLITSAYTDGAWDTWTQWLAKRDSDVNDITTSSTPPLNKAVQTSGVYRDFRFAVTKHGYLCLVPGMAQVRDAVAIIKGYKTPVLLRPWIPAPGLHAAASVGKAVLKPGPTAEYFELVGDAYVHGVMNNEVICVGDEFGCKADPTPAQLERTRRAAREGHDGKAWETLGFGDYTRVLATIGMRWVNLV
ncbi:heterokaryon incompatibility protein-domain-containing protein [Podospora appendiculata]|uniref:Heterokaryon incompatibility protein-domain-containing protein n=1 Tax=Podospora appendiculata TaxID=314037 RepID=A0AAE1CDM2_9PEZI|nr:heterokaryon incompatibility protein-domain-containing protein [Podospora appendiculata]KAK3689747.1 heterokaryon incompatibility protein-domain-containing protein [Podospora appendiculata]